MIGRIIILLGCLLLGACRTHTETPAPQTADAIVLLAGDSVERVPLAAAQFLAGAADQILLTNDGVLGPWSPSHNRNLYMIEWTEEFLAAKGVPREKIAKLPFYGSATIYDALAVKEYLRIHPLQSLLLVTNDYHVHRALWAFRLALAGPVPALQAASVPTFGFSRLKNQGLEVVKMVVYRWRFGWFGHLPPLGAPIPTFPYDLSRTVPHE